MMYNPQFSVTVTLTSLNVLALFKEEDISNLSNTEEFINNIALPFMNRKFHAAEYVGNISFRFILLLGNMPPVDLFAIVRRLCNDNITLNFFDKFVAAKTQQDFVDLVSYCDAAEDDENEVIFNVIELYVKRLLDLDGVSVVVSRI